MLSIEQLATVERLASQGFTLALIGPRLGYVGQTWLAICEEQEDILRAFSQGRAQGSESALESLGKQAAKGNVGATRAILDRLEDAGTVVEETVESTPQVNIAHPWWSICEVTKCGVYNDPRLSDVERRDLLDKLQAVSEDDSLSEDEKLERVFGLRPHVRGNFPWAGTPE